MTAISFFFFSVEIAVASIVRDDYWLGFYFWLDIISTLSLLFDIGWIMDAITGISSSNSGASGSNYQ